ncbi:hypothetical protein GCM10019815_13520 [Pediococcus damnosus]|nr:hypothetical protein PDA01_01730 [Pediococcus damnosus]
MTRVVKIVFSGKWTCDMGIIPPTMISSSIIPEIRVKNLFLQSSIAVIWRKSAYDNGVKIRR